ncbi:TPA: hypothetical protein DDW69_05015 [candidate division CPR2 bacterium]|uniref:DUF5673 domain-containing protein n=1 Tax=candidate division CPR2 bacterium GW2011_GWC1_41_48 TaxID=1618344 RepID=A0A0G0W8U1_UNCC2|nr:MAG: hypothetical protein UT47_C0002G0121 [candidate division CPR2 bacterium GW2011_GWC2_39_35]KKR27694.1 MAG: hypothetical protein UT60_C0040G0016 [candidate division CPR2 bacterium GW2011_GWD2_39_7]KKR28687.1 MAG: hypothetical protein UT59_C0021G0008 [candidate division CPR2 bacterium GW2011_GWD1_39_7]KKS09405.1 MAG: hypothetical protein UU65_C0002G0183 [candidate division CPR2 bacterium GW2011_GWC1_41_48]OGB61347.1 MAG: hypothetical protein A2Y27_01015 [candidate division CPR2 bacterium G
MAEEISSNEQTETDETNRPILAWETHEFSHFDRGKVWYIGIGTFFVILIGYFAFFRQWTSVFVFIALAIVLFRFIKSEPEYVSCEILDAGVRFNNRFYSYGDLHSFSIAYNDATKFLQLLTNYRYMYAIKIPLSNDVNPLDVRELLVRHIPEQPYEEDLIDKVSKFLKI